MRQARRAAGIKVLAIDPFVQWVPDFAIPIDYLAENRGSIDFNEEQIFQIANELEAEGLNCVEGLGQPHERARLIDAYGAIADCAATRGLRVTLEFMPISSIPDLAAGWPIVAGADRPNAGLCFDTWHYYRSTPDDALLATIPGEKIFEVQLADALNARRGKDLIEDLLRYRMLPGRGELPVASAVANLRAIGALRSVGPQIFADAMDARTSLDAARAASAAMRDLVG
jgi:sugar phosphate isomerase/epimerase